MRNTTAAYGCLAALLLAAAAVSGEERAVPADHPVELSEETKYVALTFDDGPRSGTTDRLLDGLRELGASATFFVIGEEAAQAPELVQRIQAEGHQVGNHTWSHVRLEGGDTAALMEEVRQTEALLEELLGGGPYWLRPPYGMISPQVAAQVSTPLVKWSVDPRDWESRDRDQVVRAVLDAVEPNSIILLHDIYPSSVDAALELVETLQNEGYWFVTVEELLRLNGLTPLAGEFYRSGDG